MIYSLINICLYLFQWGKLYKLSCTEDNLIKCKYAITNSKDNDWLKLGANEIETNYTSGKRTIYFPGYYVFYQAFDERDDILGGIIQRKNGKEKIFIRVEAINNTHMTSSDFEKNIFSFSIQDKTCDNAICYMNGDIQNAIQDEILKRKLQKSCDRLILCVDEFELTALSVFENNYVKKVKRIKVKMICQFVLFLFFLYLTRREVKCMLPKRGTFQI